MVVAYKDQSYSSLRKHAISSGQPFVDAEFPPNNKSLFRTDPGSSRGIEWKRPIDLVDNPCLSNDGISSHDLVQGQLGNCWMVASFACIAIHKSLWHQVIVDVKEQDWKKDMKHPGIFHFRFWRFGSWVDVVIDDHLPTKNGQLIYLHSPEKNEFWPALLEKAYAKLFGCYEALDGGDLSEALEDFSGGISESCNLIEDKKVNDEAARDEFYEWLLRASENNSMMCASIPPSSKFVAWMLVLAGCVEAQKIDVDMRAKDETEREKANHVGLVLGHAYSVTAVRKVPLAGTGIFGLFRRDKLSMIRLRNPWGDSEWKGAFSDGMTFDDFCKFFVNMSICHRVNTSIVSLQKRWHEANMDGEWSTPNRAGGCTNNKTTFFFNPQFAFDISEDKDDVMLQLLQKTTRSKTAEKLTIGFTVIKVEENRIYRLHASRNAVVGSTVFRNSRSVFWRQALTRGRYVLIPCVFEPKVVGQFMMRTYAGHDIDFRELTLDRPAKSWCSCLPCFRYPECITRVCVLKGIGLVRKEKSGDVNAYCVIRCEGESVRSAVLKKSTSPEWNTAAVFYRKSPSSKPIIIDVYHHNAVGFDEHIGQMVYDIYKDNDASVVTGRLKLKGSENAVGGSVAVEVTVSRQLESI